MSAGPACVRLIRKFTPTPTKSSGFSPSPAGKGMQAMTTDAEYQRVYGELAEAFELQERFVSAVEDL